MIDSDDDDDDNILCPHEMTGINVDPILVADLAVLGIRWAANVLALVAQGVETTAEAVAYLSNIAASHANYRRERRRFAREVGQTIERLGR